MLLNQSILEFGLDQDNDSCTVYTFDLKLMAQYKSVREEKYHKEPTYK